MKKLLALLLAFALVFSVTACSLFDNPEKDRAAVEETVKGFMDAYTAFEFDKLENFVVNKDDLSEKVAEVNMTAAFDEVMKDLPSEMAPYRQDLQKIFDDTINKVKSGLSYEITGIERSEDGDNYTVSISLTIPDFESIDFNAAFSDVASEAVLTNVLKEMIDSGKVTANTTQQEMIALLMPEVVKLIESAINDIEFEVVTEESKLVVVETDDDAWLIDLENSNFEF